MGGPVDLIATLILGSYVFTAWVYRHLFAKIDRVLRNHLDHMEVRLRRLERAPRGTGERLHPSRPPWDLRPKG